MVLVEEGLGVGSNVGFAVRVKVVVLVEVLLCVDVEVATTPVLSRARPLSGSTVEICSGGPTTSWILSAALNVANRIKLTENRFILSWMSIFIGYYDVLMKSLFLGGDLKILRVYCRFRKGRGVGGLVLHVHWYYDPIFCLIYASNSWPFQSAISISSQRPERGWNRTTL